MDSLLTIYFLIYELRVLESFIGFEYKVQYHENKNLTST